MNDLDLYDEQFALACLLEKPDENRWELDGITADLFRNPVHREIAEALIRVRDSGKRVHWRRVRWVLKAQGRIEARAFVRELVRHNGLHAGLTASISRLVYRKHNGRVP